MKRSITAVIVIVVAIACIASLTLWRGTGSGIALADVLTQIQQVSVYMYQMSFSTTGAVVHDEPVNTEVHATVLMSQDLGMKITMEMESDDPETSKPMVQDMYVLPQQQKMVTLMPGQKKYMEIDLDAAAFEEQQKQNNDPSAMVEQILACDYTSLGRSTIDGIEVEGFQTSDPNCVDGAGQVEVSIWVDVKTQLPVRFEADTEIGEEMGLGEDVHVHTVIHDFQWDVSVDASEFEPVIPDDYTAMTNEPIKMPAMDEEAALEGLKLFAELSGAYPKKLDLMTLLSQAGELATKDLPTARELHDQGKESDVDARIRARLETTMPIQGLGMFYMLLVQEGKAPAYYGDVVTPADEGQVLLRWKVSETEYRVVFGNLRAETVTPEVLAELEKAVAK